MENEIIRRAHSQGHSSARKIQDIIEIVFHSQAQW